MRHFALKKPVKYAVVKILNIIDTLGHYYQAANERDEAPTLEPGGC